MIYKILIFYFYILTTGQKSLIKESTSPNEPASECFSEARAEQASSLHYPNSEPTATNQTTTTLSETALPSRSIRTPHLQTTSPQSPTAESISQDILEFPGENIQSIDQMVRQCIEELKRASRDNDHESLCNGLYVSVERLLVNSHVTLETYNAISTISSQLKQAEDAAEGNETVYIIVKRLQILTAEALYLRKVALAKSIDECSERDVSLFLFGSPPLTVSGVNHRFRLWSRLYHEDKIKFSKPEDLPLFKKVFLLIVKIRKKVLSKIEATVGNSTYASHYKGIGHEYWASARLYKDARKSGFCKPEQLLNYTDSELAELQKTYAYKAYENYYEACKALRANDAVKEKIELRKFMALSLYATGTSDFVFEAQIFAIAAIYLLAQEKGELQREMFSQLQDVLKKIQGLEIRVKKSASERTATEKGATSMAPNTSINLKETLVETMELQLYKPYCQILAVQSENTFRREILNDVQSDLRTVLLKSCMMKGTHCKVTISESEILKVKVQSTWNITKGIGSGVGGIGLGILAAAEACKDVGAVVATVAIGGPSFLLIGGCVAGVAATGWLAYIFIKRGLESAHEPKIREKLNEIVSSALNHLNEDRFGDFLEVLTTDYSLCEVGVGGYVKKLASNYDANESFFGKGLKKLASSYELKEKREKKQLFTIEEVENEVVLTLEPNKIISELLNHEFRPDGIAYLLILIGEALLKAPKLSKRERLPGYEIAQSSFNNYAMDIFKKVRLSSDLADKAKALDDKIIRSQLKDKASVLESIWSNVQIEIGHLLHSIPRSYFEDSKQLTPYTSRLKELCSIARLNFAIANIIEGRGDNFKIGRQTIIDLKCDLEKSANNQFFEIPEVRIQAMEVLLAAFDSYTGEDYEEDKVATTGLEQQWAFIEKAVVLENIGLLMSTDNTKLACEKPILISQDTMAAELLESVLATLPNLDLRAMLKKIRDEPLPFTYQNLKKISQLLNLTFQTCSVKSDTNYGHIFALSDASVTAAANSSLPHIYVVCEIQRSVKTVIAAFILSDPFFNGLVDSLDMETDEKLKADLCNKIALHYRNEAEQLDLKHHLLALPKWHNALAYYSNACDCSSSNQTSLLGEIRCLVALNKYKKAKSLLKENMRNFLDSGEFYSLLALTHRKTRNYGDASFALQRAVELESGHKAEKKILQAFSARQPIKQRVKFYGSNSVTKNSSKIDSEPYNILSVDGGGVRGLIPAVWLSELERRTSQVCASLFHMMGGTSTGAIITAGLSAPDLDDPNIYRYKASDILELYTTKSSAVFTRSLLSIDRIKQMLSYSPKYTDFGRKNLFNHYFGDTLFSQSLTDLVIPAVKSGSNGSVIFSSRESRTDPLTRTLKMKDVLMCTTAAPTFFPPYKLGETLYVDGGVQANNPTMAAYVKAISDYKVPRDKIFVLSLGTGDYVPNELDPSGNRNLLFWIANRAEIPKVIFDGPMNNLDQHMYSLLNEGCYNRWQVWFEDRVALDDCRAETLELLYDLAQEHFEVMDAYDDNRRLGKIIEKLRGDIA